MTWHECMTRMPSWEFTAWMVLEGIRAKEAKHERDVAESGDGQVIVTGADPDVDDDDEDLVTDDDGETE
jgi:hypothetical protein